MLAIQTPRFKKYRVVFIASKLCSHGLNTSQRLQAVQIAEPLSLAFRCLRPSTAPATVSASASASVM
ncbi:hypothetical protein F7R20_04025 [Pseudomonas brassicacearum subsp. brassicacearum]|nr:hypothetical protein F7R20_04025 [Pseudomonas brassicacearum subsp. brassicacearum]PJH89957.1 hypothetical protein CVG87_04595 [Pseudomonas sp. WCS365]QEO77960.1 hypothetical protein ELZ14_10460 [Pseudomonas brassicacearum]